MNILVVDDSRVVRLLLREVFQQHGYRVFEAESGEQALEMVQKEHIDIITMDVHMPGINGFETTERILELRGIPIIILSASTSVSSNQAAIRALEAGALAILEKPENPLAENFDSQIDELTRTVRIMREVRVIRRRRKTTAAASKNELNEKLQTDIAELQPKVVIIAASAGGPGVLKEILSTIKAPFPLPIVLIQHIAPGFSDSFINWLQRYTGMEIRLAANHQSLKPNQVIIPPDNYQLAFSATQNVYLTERTANHPICPSADITMQSAARTFQHTAIGIQLSGMGKDGAIGIQMLHQVGAITLAQKPQSATIASMPEAAIRTGAVSHILTPAEIGAMLNKIAEQVQQELQIEE
ncbi:chemotaxis protein CheB [Pseudidiomarina marina]|uniref:chemotaxis protein CheB n=1 Tax=Pseudidiomarina marina TaxID=502366 RepID=UPI00384C7A3A